MRARSASVYIKNRAEPAKTSPNTPPNELDNQIEPTSSIPMRKHHSCDSYSLTLFEDFGPMCASTFKDAFAGDFGSKNPEIMKTSLTPSETKSRTSTFMDSLTDEFLHDLAELEENLKPQKILRGMVIGARDVGKRSLINTLFPGDEEHVEKKEFDLVSRTFEKEDAVERYQFWVKEPVNDGKYPQYLWDPYYKSCSVFFLVYDVADRSSFYSLDEELEMIYQANQNRDIMVVLVGNKKGNGFIKKISLQEAGSLKEKFDIKIFLEMDVKTETPSDLGQFLECFLKEIH